MKIPFDRTLPTALGNCLKSEYSAGQSCQVPISGLVTMENNDQIQFIVPYKEGSCEYIYFAKTSFPQEGFFNETLVWGEVSFQGCFISTMEEYLKDVGAEVLNTRVGMILEIEGSYALQIFTIPAFCRGVLYSLLPDIRAERETVVETVVAHSHGFVYLENKEVYRLKGWNYYILLPEDKIERNGAYTVAQNPSEWAGLGALSFQGSKYGILLERDGVTKCTEFDFPWEYSQAIENLTNPKPPRRGGGERRSVDRKTTTESPE